MKLEYIVESTFIRQVIEAVEKMLESAPEDQGSVTLRVCGAEFSRPHPSYDKSVVALDFFWVQGTGQENEGDSARFEVRVGDGSSKQYFSVYLEVERQFAAQCTGMEYFFICQDVEKYGQEQANALAEAMRKIFFDASVHPIDLMEQLSKSSALELSTSWLR